MEILMYISTGMIIFAYIFYLLLVIFNRRKKISSISGFDVSKDVLDEYGRINIILGNKYFSFYNSRRGVIKLSNNDYYGSDLSSISLSLIQSGISTCKGTFIDYFKKIFASLKVIELFGFISIILNHISTSVGDAKIGIFVVGIIILIRYFYMDILCDSYNFVMLKIKKIKEIDKINKEKILSFIDKVILCNRVLFIGELIILIRFVMILLKF